MSKTSDRIGLLSGLLIALVIGTDQFSQAQSGDSPWPSVDNFAKGPSMKTARMGFWQASLSDGRVSAFGGHGKGFVSLKTADVWSPSTNTFSTLTMKYTHDASAFAKLADGRYLIAGGSSDLGVPAYSWSEIFDPDTNVFTTTGNMVRFRSGGAAATLKNGKVLIAGAWWIHNDAHTYGELYDPATGKFKATGPMKVRRANAIAIPTNDGKAVVAGGMGPQADPAYIEKIDLYNPATNAFTILRNTLIAGETGWYFNQMTCMRAIADQRMDDGKYLLTAYKIEGTTGYSKLITFDPAKKRFALLDTNPGLPDSSVVSFSWAPIVDHSRQMAYLVGTLPTTTNKQKHVLYAIDLTTMNLTEVTGQYTAAYYTGSSGQALLQDGRILVNGGTKDGTNFNPVANSFLARPE